VIHAACCVPAVPVPLAGRKALLEWGLTLGKSLAGSNSPFMAWRIAAVRKLLESGEFKHSGGIDKK
jgi:hypothetical protein